MQDLLFHIFQQACIKKDSYLESFFNENATTEDANLNGVTDETEKTSDVTKCSKREIVAQILKWETGFDVLAELNKGIVH